MFSGGKGLPGVNDGVINTTLPDAARSPAEEVEEVSPEVADATKAAEADETASSGFSLTGPAVAPRLDPEKAVFQVVAVMANGEAARVEMVLRKAIEETPRLRELGNWPVWVEDNSVTERIPKVGDTNAPGFDAGIASALDLIPRNKQRLAAILHAAYTPEAVQKLIQEMESPDADSESVWWLAARHICTEGGIDQMAFLDQIERFNELAKDPNKRLEAAKAEFRKMTTSFNFIPELGDEVPYGTVDGCIQGAYLAGHRFGVVYLETYGIYFIGTYEPTLGLENFPWSDARDENGRPKSGPVYGSKQFVKAASMEELQRAIEVVKAHFLSRAERPELVSLSSKVHELFPGSENGRVRRSVLDSFDVPQRGPYHTEGVFMDAHLALCRKTIQDIKEGVFPEEIPPDVREVLSRVVAQYGEQLERYVFLHDIAKGECLRFKYKDGTSREVTLDDLKLEWTEENHYIWAKPVHMEGHLDGLGVESISYYHKDKRHGEASREMLEQMGYTGVPSLILTAIAKHEVAFSFKDANAAGYADHFGALTPEERDIVLTASYIDTMASLRPNGKPDLTDFKALIDSRYNFELLALVAAKLKAETQFKPAAIDDRLSKLTVGIKMRIEGSVDEIAARVIKALQPATFNMARVETGLSALVSAGSITEDQKRRILELLSAGGLPALGKEFGRFMGKIKPVLDAAKDE